MMSSPPWNANTHYHHLILAALPGDATRVLDVGCGDGLLSAALIDAGVPRVVGLDIDGGVLARARARHAGLPVEWVQGDALRIALEPESFDAAVSVAALHHMNAAEALTRFSQLVRPGGVVAIVGLAASEWRDLPAEAVALAIRTAIGAVRGHWEHSAPQCWPPPLTYRQMKALSTRILPGARFRRHLLGRYSLIWEK